MNARFVVSIASGVSALIIAVCLVFVVVLLQDINTLYDDVMDDMRQFKVRALKWPVFSVRSSIAQLCKVRVNLCVGEHGVVFQIVFSAQSALLARNT